MRARFSDRPRTELRLTRPGTVPRFGLRRVAGAITVALLVLGLTQESAIAQPEETPPPNPAAPRSLDEMPSSNRQDVTRLLAKIRRRYGEDALLIDTQLLLNAMRNPSFLATGARVDGVKDHRGKRYLGFGVETGLVFDDNTRNETERIHMLWHTIMTPTLERLKTLTVPADGIMVRMQYHRRPYASMRELRDTIREPGPGPSEEAAFYLLTSDVGHFIDRRVSARELIARAHITVDGTERTVPIPTSDEPRLPGPE